MQTSLMLDPTTKPNRILHIADTTKQSILRRRRWARELKVVGGMLKYLRMHERLGEEAQICFLKQKPVSEPPITYKTLRP